MASTAFLNQAYLAYFGRPVDTSGAIAYASATEAKVMADFSASPESIALYGSTFNLAQVNAIYTTLFGRPAELVGANYWLAEVAAGRQTPASAAVAILNGALGNDAVIVANKLTASAAFTTNLDTIEEALGYSGATAAASARTFLGTVTLTAATPAAVTNAVAVTISAGASGVNAGTTFTLTTGADSFTGTSANDTFNAIVDATATTASATTGDTLNGGAGTDTLNLIATTAATSGLLTLNSVETVNIRALANVTVDNLLFTGTTKVVSANSTGAVTLNNAALAATYSLENTATGSQANLNVNFRAADVTGTTDVAALSINTVGSSVAVTGALPTVTTPVITLGAGVETITLATAGTNFAQVTSTTATKLVTVTGAGTNTLTFGTLNATSTIDASTSTGTNTFDVGTGLTSGDTFKGGTGIDTVAGTLSGANTGVVLTGVEGFTANATSTGVTLLTADAALVTLTDNSAAALTIGGAGSLKTIALNGTGVAATAATQNSTLVLTTAFAGAADSVAVTIGNRGVAFGAFAQTASLTASGIETLSVTTADAVLNNALALNVADTGLQNLSITSLNAVTLTGIVAGTVGGTLTLLDTSASTGNFTFTQGTAGLLATGAIIKLGGTLLSTNTVTLGAEAATDIITITGSAAADTIIVSTAATAGGNGTYIVTLGGATDTTANAFTGTGATAVNVTGAGGVDTIIGSAGADTITGGNGADTITGAAGNDIIILTETVASIDKVVFSGAGLAATAAAQLTANGTDTITGFGVIDTIAIGSLGDGNTPIVGLTVATLSTQVNLTNDIVNIVNTTGAAANFTTAGTAVITDFTNTTQVAAYLTEHYATANNNTSVFVVNNTTAGANTSYVYSFVDATAGVAAFSAAELALVGIITNSGTGLTAANVVV
jgi:hypothetical protein